MVRVRFAPSPTGKLHVGNMRTTLANVLFARKNGGKFIVRIEDTDLEREVLDSEKRIFSDLEWLGLTPDESPYHGGEFAPYRTSERADRGDYKKVLEKLMADGRAYECFVSQTELDLMRKIQTSQGLPPHYDNRHRDLSEEEKEKFRAEGREPVIRFKLEDGEISWDDMVRGAVKYEAKNLGGDPVIVRSNGVPLFAFAAAVDDIAQNITHVIRGEDHVTNTATQIQIFKALGANPPVMAHLPMLADKDGSKLSKRIDSLSIAQLREEGYVPNAILTYLASLGFSTHPEIGDANALSKDYDMSKMGRSAARVDDEQMKSWNATALHNMSYTEAKPYLSNFIPMEQSDADLEKYWTAFRENCELLADAKHYYDLCFGVFEPVVLEAEDRGYIEEALSSLPTGEYNADTWMEWVNTLKSSTGRKGKGLFMPLRLALTGESHGPEMGLLLPIFGEEGCKNRLEATLKKAQAT